MPFQPGTDPYYLTRLEHPLVRPLVQLQSEALQSEDEQLPWEPRPRPDHRASYQRALEVPVAVAVPDVSWRPSQAARPVPILLDHARARSPLYPGCSDR